FNCKETLPGNETDAIYYQDPAEHCRREAALLRQELEEEQTGTRTALENARERATMILKLDGLTGAEIEAAEKVLSGDSVQKAHIQRLREIAVQVQDIGNTLGSGHR